MLRNLRPLLCATLIAVTTTACGEPVLDSCSPTNIVPAVGTVKLTAGVITIGKQKPKSVSVEYKVPDDHSLGGAVLTIVGDHAQAQLICWPALELRNPAVGVPCTIEPYPDSKLKQNVVALAGDATVLQHSGALVADDMPQPGDVGDVQLRLDLSGQSGNGLLEFELQGVVLTMHITWGQRLCYTPG